MRNHYASALILIAALMCTNHVTANDDTAGREQEATHPFLEFNGLIDGAWFTFFVVAVASSRLATVFVRVGLPVITGYMIIGCLCGPYVLNLVSTTQVKELGYVTQVALAFIAFSAGSELYLPELRHLFRSILWISFFLATITYVFCSGIIYLLATSHSLVPWASTMGNGCIAGVSLVAASIMTARSPASAIAVVKELKAKGSVTSTMLGVTVFGDLVVLILFTVSASIAMTLCAGTGFEGGAFLITLLTLVAAMAIGYALGGLLIFLLWIPRVPAYMTIIPLGFFIFLLCDWFAIYSFNKYGFSLNFDALLVCITAGYVVTNQSKNRVAFLHMLSTAGPYIFIPFFTKVGIELNLVVLAKTLPFAIIVFTARAACVAAGCYCGGMVVGLDSEKKKWMWTSMLAQAGVSLGLASEVAVKFPAWGSDFQSTIVGVVLINQFVGPVACKWALKKLGEAGKASDDGEEHEHGGEPVKLKRVVFVGGVHTSTVVGVAQKLLNTGKHGVLAFDTNTMSLDKLYKVLTVPQKHHDDIHSAIAHTPGHVEPVDVAEHLHIDVQQQSPAVKVNNDNVELAAAPTTARSHEPHKRAKNTQYIITQKLNQTDNDDICVTISNTMKTLALDDSATRNVGTVCIHCDTDVETYTVALFCIDTLNIPRVVATIRHPSYAALMSQHSIIPIYDPSTSSQLLYTAISAADAKTYKYVSTVPTDTLASLHSRVIDPKIDLDAYINTMEEQQRRLYLETCKPVDVNTELNIKASLTKILTVNKIDVTNVVADAQLDMFHNTMAQSYMITEPTDIIDTTHANDMVSGPLGMAHSRHNTQVADVKIDQLKHANNHDDEVL